MHAVAADKKVLGVGEWLGVRENQAILTEAQRHDHLTGTRFSQRPVSAQKTVDTLSRRRIPESGSTGVEWELFAQLLELGPMLLRAFVDGQGDGDSGARVAIDGLELRRLSGLRERRDGTCQ